MVKINFRRSLTVISIVSLAVLIIASTATAAPIVYFESDFSDGTLGGGVSNSSLNIVTGEVVNGPVENVDSSGLDGLALGFEIRERIQFRRPAAALDSRTHYVRLDYFAEPGANITTFLDAPAILRLDVSVPGRHTLEAYYDLDTQEAYALLDGILTQSLFTILVFSDPGASRTVRIGNQFDTPGSSRGVFEVDNFTWQGNVDIPRFVPEPGTALLMGLGLLGLASKRLGSVGLSSSD